METPAASAMWAAEQVAAELREAYLAVATAAALLERTGGGSAHPALRQARRCGEDALDLAAHSEKLLGQGIQRLHHQLGRVNVTSVGQVAGALTTSRTQFAEAAERVIRLPDQLRAAGQRLRAADDPDLRTETVTDGWSRAANQLGLMTKSLVGAVAALTSYTDDLTGAAG